MSIGRTQGTHHVLEQRLIPRVYEYVAAWVRGECERETGTNKGSLGSTSFSRDQSAVSARSRNQHAWEEACREIDQKRLKTCPFLANRGGCIERYILVYSGHHLNQSL